MLFSKKMELPIHATLWVSLRNEGSPTKKSTICEIPSVEKSRKDKSDLQLWKRDQYLPEAGVGGWGLTAKRQEGTFRGKWNVLLLDHSSGYTGVYQDSSTCVYKSGTFM